MCKGDKKVILFLNEKITGASHLSDTVGDEPHHENPRTHLNPGDNDRRPHNSCSQSREENTELPRCRSTINCDPICFSYSEWLSLTNGTMSHLKDNRQILIHSSVVFFNLKGVEYFFTISMVLTLALKNNKGYLWLL